MSTLFFKKGLNVLELCKSGAMMLRVLIICVLEIVALLLLRVAKVPAFRSASLSCSQLL